MTKQRLRELVTEAKATQTVSEELAVVIIRIARGLAKRFRYWGDTEDYAQDCVVHVMSKLGQIDVDRNVFCYLTTMCRNLWWNRYRKAGREAANRREFYERNKNPRRG